MPDKRLPATVDRAVREKTTERRTGIRWDNAVEKIWKDLRGDQEEVLSIEKLGGYRGSSKIYQGYILEERERLALKNKVKARRNTREIYAGG